MEANVLFDDMSRSLIGVVHLRATPGAPGGRAGEAWVEGLAAAVADGVALAQGGCDGIIVENFGDVPFFAEEVPAETVAAMALAVAEIRRAVVAVGAVGGMRAGGATGTTGAAGGGERELAVGVNVLRNDWRSALGICAATGASFVRVNVFTGAAVTDQGLIQGRAAEVLRERDRLCPGVAVLADVHVKHAVPLGGGAIGEAARDTLLRGGADGVIVSGSATGGEVDLAELREVREAVGGIGAGGSNSTGGNRGRVLVGSGLTEGNARELMALADGAIVGTWVKEDGDVRRPVDVARVRRIRAALDEAAG